MRENFQLECTKCKRRNYIGSRNKKLKTVKLESRKYCKWDRIHTLHREVK